MCLINFQMFCGKLKTGEENLFRATTEIIEGIKRPTKAIKSSSSSHKSQVTYSLLF